MPTPFRPRLGALLLLAALLVSSGGAAAALPTDRGFPLIQTYTPPIPEVESQNFGIARDPRGVLYIANDSGVVVYDGAWWQRVPIGKRRTAWDVTSDPRGRIAVGGTDDLGLLEPDARGTLRYISLLDKLPPGDRNDLGQVFRVYPNRQGFSFMAQSSLLQWDGSRLTTVVRFPPGKPYPVSFQVGDQLYVWWREGIFRLAGERLQPVPGGDLFRGRRVDQILPAGPGGLLVSVREEGLFLLRDGRATPFAPEASAWARQSRILSGLLLPDGRWALGSIVGGLLLLRPDGAIDQVIDSQRGLPNDFVFSMVLDREGALWLALNSGLVRVEITSPLSTIDGRTGLRGSVYAAARHRGGLWVGTATGLFTNLEADGAGGLLRMRAVPGLPPGVWSLLSTGDDLLAGSAGGLYRVGPSDAAERISPPDVSTVYVLERSESDPDRVWLGTIDGLASVRRQGGAWRWEGKIGAVPVEIRSIVESRGVLWCGTEDGLVGLRLPLTGAPPAFRIAGDKTNVFRAGGGLMAIRDGHVFRLDETRGRLAEDAALTRLASGSPDSIPTEDAEGNLWLGTRPPSVAVRQGDGWSLRAVPEISARGVEPILAEPDGTVWLAGETQIFRYEGKLRERAAALPSPPLLGRLTEGSRLLFGGAPGASPGLLELPYNARRLRIEFAPLSFRAGLRYQTRLEPLDAAWSAPTAEPFAELARIPPGEYTFHVRTLGPGGAPGPETYWPFHVRPPWYQSFWAIALWLALALLVVRGWAEIRERTLRQRAARLESRVNEQTVELRGKVEELGRAHADLAAANARLEEISQRDELTGIANRRRLQQALDAEWSHTRQAIAFILIDLDSFKLLNDTQGHLAGDLCLQAVAGLVDREARRQGGLAARYGGEELAVLLPGVNLSTALEIAERLRQGIEALAIPHPSAPLGRVTASLGVATLGPSPGGSAEDLIEAADMALYRAKAEGKNRVAAGGVRQGKGASENSAA